MNNNQKKRKNNKESGYTLLEYAAGAAVLMGLLYIGVQALGGGVQSLLTDLGSWAAARSSDLNR